MTTPLSRFLSAVGRKTDNVVVRAILTATLSNIGLEFDYKEDWVIRIWPWDRKWAQSCPWCSSLLGRTFESLEQMNKAWTLYNPL